MSGRASSDVKDFLYSEGAHGRLVLPAWALQMGEVYGVDPQGIIQQLKALDQTAQADLKALPELPKITSPLTFDQAVKALAVPKENTQLTKKEKKKLIKSLKDYFKGLWGTYICTSRSMPMLTKLRTGRATNLKKLDYEIFGSSPAETYFKVNRLPLVDGERVELKNPRGMQPWQLIAWANHLSNASLNDKDRFDFIGTASRLAARGSDMPESVQIAQSNRAADSGLQQQLSPRAATTSPPHDPLIDDRPHDGSRGSAMRSVGAEESEAAAAGSSGPESDGPLESTFAPQEMDIETAGSAPATTSPPTVSKDTSSSTTAVGTGNVDQEMEPIPPNVISFAFAPIVSTLSTIHRSI